MMRMAAIRRCNEQLNREEEERKCYPNIQEEVELIDGHKKAVGFVKDNVQSQTKKVRIFTGILYSLFYGEIY